MAEKFTLRNTGGEARRVSPLVDKANDAPPAELTQRMQVHEKTARMLRAMLEK